MASETTYWGMGKYVPEVKEKDLLTSCSVSLDQSVLDRKWSLLHLKQ